nr:acylneuraminate cytidylyltransferase family protein [Acidobacteriota bacterium]
MSDGSVVGAVFARGGSKGVPGKNLRLLGGKPLLAHSLDALAGVPGLARLVVSTDDEAIARAAQAWGAQVLERPAPLATDTAPEWLAWQHLADSLGPSWGTSPGDIMLSAPTTAPLRSCSDLIAALDRLRATDDDIVIAVTPAARNPYFNMVTLTPEGSAALVIRPDSPVTQRQHAPMVYDVTTVVFAPRARYIRAEHA